MTQQRASLRGQGKAALLGAAATGAAAVFPVLFLWGSNAALVPPGGALRYVALYLAGALVLYALLLLFSRAPAPSALTAIAGVLLFSNFAYLQRALAAFTQARYWHALAVVALLGYLLGIAFFFLLPRAGAAGAVRVLAIAFAALLAVNLVRVVPAALAAGGGSRSEEAAATVEATDKPNIYYFIFDEYADGRFMEEYYGYDSAWLAEELGGRGFAVSGSSSNSNCSTILVTANILSLENRFGWEDQYTTEERRAVVQQAREEGEAFRLLREAGYTLEGLGHPEYYGLPAAGGTLLDESVTVSGETFDNLLLASTPLYPLNRVNTAEAAQNTLAALAWFEDEGNYSAGPRLIMTHLLVPHTPFVFNAAGEAVSVNHFNDWDDPQYYIGQHEFTSNSMLKLADAIQKHDPGAIIAFTSDHSARASTTADFYQNPRFAPEDMAGCFQALYLGGESADIEGMGGVNVMRTLLSAALGTELEPLPEPGLDPAYLAAFEGGGAE